jgi:hypothetical protein
MWNENTPMDLLNNLPLDLNAQNEAEIQMVIDQHKYEQSAELNCDLCGVYAPFCQVCDKSANFPCARAYIASKQKEVNSVEVTTSMPVEIEQTDDVDLMPIPDATEEQVQQPQIAQSEDSMQQEQTAQDLPVEKKPEEQTTKSQSSKKIRIAVARRKKAN